MSISSILRQSFLQHVDPARPPCLEINSVYKKPSWFYFTAHHIPATNQLVWEGVVKPYGGTEYEVFCMFENADTLRVHTFLMDLVGIVEDPTDICVENPALLTRMVVDLKKESVWITN